MKVGIGFVTGRKSFQKVLSTNIYNWKESGILDDGDIGLNLFVAYDLAYTNTKRTDYTNIRPELKDELTHSTFIGKSMMEGEVQSLTENNVITADEAKLLFGTGYAAKRNAVLYQAIKQKMDCLVFLDDDEYPMAVTHNKQVAIWSGQFVLAEHLQNISNSDITHGYHCGYISPIPYLEFNNVLKEDDFKMFIEAISNDIISWEKIKSVMQNGGITYADTDVLVGQRSFEVPEIGGAKFISGANLCIKLTDCTRVFPFYNPPGARGEDTFLSTCLSERKVVRVPCYNFHDGFLTYRHLLEGVLPVKLKFIKADSAAIITRFYKACIGWIRYKPMLVYITDPKNFEAKMEQIHSNLIKTLPKICAFFDSYEFMSILKEFEKYRKNVERHAENFENTKLAWAKIMRYFKEI